MNTASTASQVVQTMTELPSLVDNLLLLLSDKEKLVIKKRFNLDGTGRSTLEEIGQEFSVTRERVRQIEKNALGKMKRNIFNTSLKSLHDFVFSIVRKHGGFLRKDRMEAELLSLLIDSKIASLSSLGLSFSLHENLESIGNTINFHPYLREKAFTEYSLKYASNQLVNQLYKYGDVKNVSKIHEDLRSVFDELNFDLVKLKSLIDIDKRLTLLENDLVALIEWRHINPRTLRDKILYILRNEKKSMHFMTLAEKIKAANFDNRSINLQAVHNELIRHDQFVLIGRGIYALSEWGYERGTVADVVENVLKEKGEMAQDEIIDEVLRKRQVKKITVVLALKNNKKFLRVGRKRYKLKV